MTPNLARLSGPQLADLLEQAARRAGVSPSRFAAPFKLVELRRTQSPKAHTRTRIAALLARQPVPPPRPYRFRSGLRGRDLAGPPLPVAAPPRRDPCFKCGTRGDIGCAHQPPAGGAVP